jgi:aromatic-amino-acid transaminase
MFRRLTPIPRNMLITLGYSISKSHTQYGLRTGAFIGLSQDRGVLDEFVEVNGASARGVWTNVPRAGMRLCALLHQNPTLLKKVNHEREVLRRMLTYRASVFLEEADESDLTPMPYRSGFFISIPHPDPPALARALAEQLVFTVPMAHGVRLAISGISARKIAGVAAAIKSSLSSLAP